MNEDMLNLQDTARRLKVHENTIRRLVNMGQLRAVRISTRGDLRFRLRDIEIFLEQRETPVNT